MKTKIKNKEQQINWNKPQLVIGKSGRIILTNGKYTENVFEGIVLSSPFLNDTMYFNKSFCKSAFKLFDGEITLSND